MNFIKKFIDSYKEQSRKDAENAVKQEAAVAALQGGAIFPRAKERIDREKALGREFFSSDLTVREYLLCREAQLETIGQVMGSCFYSISLFGLMGRTMGLSQSEYNHDKFVSTIGSLVKESSELVDITAAQLKARRNAVDRMLLEARELGAHGVIGVRVKASHFNWATRLTEFTAIGTAIRLPGYKSDGTVFTSDLNGQEFWQLYNAGYLPRELSFGVCTYYIKCDPETRQIIDPTLIDFMKGRSTNNQEIVLFSQGFYEARSLAMDRLTSDAMAVNADGIVSVDVDYSIQTVEYMQYNKTFHDPVVHFIATGTSIKKVQEHTQPMQKPKMCLSLRGGTWVDIGSYDSFIPSSMSYSDDDFDDE
ncbi:MAG: heavy metal-binding domain-containing protein [Candidatus Obscuribacterales bacterium]|nr:heavy metal-binding domain-containing protein [Candidatus Obscuribacterales bacterium]